MFKNLIRNKAYFNDSFAALLIIQTVPPLYCYQTRQNPFLQGRQIHRQSDNPYQLSTLKH